MGRRDRAPTQPGPSVENTRIDWGRKHNGKTFGEVFDMDVEYCRRCLTHITNPSDRQALFQNWVTDELERA